MPVMSKCQAMKCRRVSSSVVLCSDVPYLASFHLEGENAQLSQHLVPGFGQPSQLLRCIFGYVEGNLHRVPRLAFCHIQLLCKERRVRIIVCPMVWHSPFSRTCDSLSNILWQRSGKSGSSMSPWQVRTACTWPSCGKPPPITEHSHSKDRSSRADYSGMENVQP